MDAPTILANAAEHIHKRGQQHDNAANGERNMARIVRVFNELTRHQLTEEDGWKFMVCLKLVRSETSSGFNPDHYEDGAAYFALAGEAAQNACVSDGPADAHKSTSSAEGPFAARNG